MSTPPPHYQHMQSARMWVFLPVVLVVAGVWIAAVAAGTGVWPTVVLLLSALLVGALILAVTKLTVAVSATEASLWWRFGRPRKRIDRTEITSATVVRNRWWYGWGVRWIPGGWMWNVWGLDAVELTLANDTKFRIGTDQPDELAAALQL